MLNSVITLFPFCSVLFMFLFCFSSFYVFILILILALYVNNKYLVALLGKVDSSTMETRKLCVYHRREGGERSGQCGGGRRETHEDQGAERPGESQPSSTQFCLRTKEQPQQPSAIRIILLRACPLRSIDSPKMS